MRTILIALVALLLAPFSLAVAAGPAHADQYTHHDAKRDVLDNDDANPSPRVRQADIRFIRMQHRADDVRIVVQARIARSGQRVWSSTIKTGGSGAGITTYGLTVFAVQGDPTGTVRFQRVIDGTDPDVACDGITTRIVYNAATIAMVVPRSCLGDPQWVKGTTTLSWSGACDGDLCDYSDYFDYALETGEEDTGYPGRLSPKIYRRG